MPVWKDKVVDRSKVGATYRSDAGIVKPPLQARPATLLLSITCSLCIVLTLFCSCLIAFLILLGHWSDSSYFTDHPYAMSHAKVPSDLNFRLPKAVKPLHYDLYLHPNLKKGTFKGRVTISINVSDRRNYIALHQKDLNITATNLRYNDNIGGREVEIKDAYNVEQHEAFIVSTQQELPIGFYKLTLEFEGALQPNKIVGFYSSRYKDEQNRMRYIATSKFEPTYARRAFPCFDEPGFKADFSVKLVHPNGDCYSALSNMNVESSLADQPSQGLTTVTFAKSVPMSTYLACFIVSDFVAVTAKAKGLHGTTFPVSVYTTRAQKEKGSFALDVGVQIIEYYIKLFQIDYPLPKLDMVAIPDFVSGAMENWGLVTYREAYLLYDEKSSSTANKKVLVKVVAHEFAHMWFGNLVTMKWWNDLWLNEGFATYMQFKSSDAIFPEWGLMDQFLINEIHLAFAVDSKVSSHPIVQTVSNPDQITAIFDDISYQKGASILRMLDNFVGSDLFYAGITKYLNKFMYKNAETADLFDILQDEVGTKININNIMDTWTRQMGFPVVKVARSKQTSYILTQERFLDNPEAKFDPSQSSYGYKWTIPITYITSDNSTPTLVWFDMNASKLVIKLDEPVEWIKFNVDQIGYYRVNYDRPEWDTLVNFLRWSHKRFSVSDRTHLLEDAFSLAAAAHLDYSVAMNMTVYLSGERHFVPWSVAASKLTSIDTLLSSTDVSEKFRDYVRNLVDSTYHEVTWNVDNTEDHITLNLRTQIVNLACSVGHKECLDEVGEIFKNWIYDKSDKRPHPDIRGFVYYYGMNHVGGEAEWDIMFKRFVDESNAAEKLKLMHGLAGARSSFLIKKMIGVAMDETYVRSQDTMNLLRDISSNPEGTSLVWDWVRENWDVLVKRYTLNDRYLGKLIPGITSTFATEVKLNEVNTFFAKYPEAGAGEASRKQAIETIKTNIKWLEHNSAKISSWLVSQS